MTVVMKTVLLHQTAIMYCIVDNSMSERKQQGNFGRGAVCYRYDFIIISYYYNNYNITIFY